MPTTILGRKIEDAQHIRRALQELTNFETILSEAEIEKEREVEMRSKATVEAKAALNFKNNKEAEDALLVQLDRPVTSSRSHLSASELKHFAEINKEQLKGFIYVRIHSNAKSKGGMPKNKRKLAEAVQGADNLIRAAYDAREKPLLLQQRTPSEDEGVSIPQAMELRLDVPTKMCPSFRVTAGFVEIALASYTIPADMAPIVPLETLQTKTDNLHKILYGRLATHISSHVPTQLQDHYVWKFARQNLGRMAATMIVLGHIKKDFGAAEWDGQLSLLTNVAKGTFADATALLDGEGCYLFYDLEGGTFVRSGKVSGRPVSQRFKEHKTAAGLENINSLQSQFYTSYPSESADVPDELKKLRQGSFEDLKLYGGITFNSKDVPEAIYRSNGESLIYWDEFVVQSMQTRFTKVKPMEDKKRHFAGYLYELVYDLAISPQHNVSQSPGFETPLGLFRNSAL